MYKYFNGEKQNPYNRENQNAQFNFWNCELIFDHHFKSSDFSIDSWANTHAEDIKEWRDVLSNNPVNKVDLFKLWLHNLLVNHLPEKHVSDKDKFLNLYCDSEA